MHEKQAKLLPVLELNMGEAKLSGFLLVLHIPYIKLINFLTAVYNIDP